jgi:CheY-like chemotaxis protein
LKRGGAEITRCNGRFKELALEGLKGWLVISCSIRRRWRIRGSNGTIVPSLMPSATVLVADDEPAVRNLCKTILTRSGYDVIATPDGESALTASADGRRTIDLALVDLVMAGMSGVELAHRLVVRGIKVILMSGYPEGSEQNYLDPLLPSAPCAKAIQH